MLIAFLICPALAETTDFSPLTLPNGVVSKSYSQTIVASDNSTSDDIYTYSVVAGALPPGLSLDASTGTISGTPIASGTSSFTIQADSNDGDTGTINYDLTITPPMAISPSTLPPASLSVAYSQTISASNGAPPYTYSVSVGSLPPGLALNSSTGTLSGTPTSSGTYAFTVEALDQTGNSATQSFTLDVGTNSLTIGPSAMPPATQGVAYSQAVAASGGMAPYSYSVSSGALPAGLSLNPGSGVISGTPTGSGPSSFTITALDPNGNTGSTSYTMNVGLVLLTISPSSLPTAWQNVAYSQTLTASGGTGPYSYSVVSGALPTGLSLNAATGVISGTPTTRGSFAFTIQANDSVGNAGSQAYAVATSRPNPADDPEVRGLVAAQAATASRFANAQTSNLTRHLESLHSGFDPCSTDVSIGVVTVAPQAAPLYGADPTNPPLPGSPECQFTVWPALSVWASGNLEFGKGTLPGGSASNGFSTSGLTAGATEPSPSRWFIPTSATARPMPWRRTVRPTMS